VEIKLESTPQTKRVISLSSIMQNLIKFVAVIKLNKIHILYKVCVDYTA